LAIEGDELSHLTAAKRVGITRHIGWHTIRQTYTTLLHANGEDVKVVKELLRHGSSKITMDVYAQVVTPARRRAQGKAVAVLRDTKKEEQTG
jgi:site-specific recombinase XerD